MPLKIRYVCKTQYKYSTTILSYPLATSYECFNIVSYINMNQEDFSSEFFKKTDIIIIAIVTNNKNYYFLIACSLSSLSGGSNTESLYDIF